jgi:hypothetical protein
LQAKLAELDEDGWSKREIVDGEVRPSALHRIRYESSLLREEILELSLGVGEDESVSEKLK